MFLQLLLLFESGRCLDQLLLFVTFAFAFKSLEVILNLTVIENSKIVTDELLEACNCLLIYVFHFNKTQECLLEALLHFVIRGLCKLKLSKR